MRALRPSTLKRILGDDGHGDLLMYLILIEATDWSRVPYWHNARMTGSGARFPLGRTGPSGDWIWIDPELGIEVRDAEAKARRSNQSIPQSGQDPGRARARTFAQAEADAGIQREAKRRRREHHEYNYGNPTSQTGLIVIDDDDDGSNVNRG